MSHTVAGPTPPDEPAGEGRGGTDELDRIPGRGRLTPTKWLVTGLLLVAIVAPLLVSTYDQVNPRLFGFPFFYWYQLLWVFLAAAFCGLSFLLLKREQASYRRRADRDRGEL